MRRRTKFSGLIVAGLFLGLGLAGCGSSASLDDVDGKPKASAKTKKTKTASKKSRTENQRTASQTANQRTASVAKPAPRKTSPAAARPASSSAALSAGDLQQVLAGNSVYLGGAEQKFAAHHASDGSLKGKAWTGDGTQSGAGAWKINEDGTYCRKWDNGWAGGQWGCFKVYRKGNALTMERVSGAGANGQMTLVPGNAYGLK
jgi:hypothetical protein